MRVDSPPAPPVPWAGAPDRPLPARRGGHWPHPPPPPRGCWWRAPARRPCSCASTGGTAAIGTAAAVVRLSLPPGASVDAFAATRGGWLAVGSIQVAGGRELALWSGGAGKADRAAPPAPPGRVGAVRAFPVPLLRDGELVGLAWLEGEAADRFAVLASAWDGRQWSAPDDGRAAGAGQPARR